MYRLINVNQNQLYINSVLILFITVYIFFYYTNQNKKNNNLKNYIVYELIYLDYIYIILNGNVQG